MSFKTSPILNRLKNIKGWKQSSFPTKTSNYSRDVTLGLKIYLLLKAYLSINNFKLLMCQLRSYEKFHTVVYIILAHSNTHRKVKKIALKQYFSNLPKVLYLPKNKKVRSLLYRNLLPLKQFTSYTHNWIQKKRPSQYWWKRTYLENWVFFSLKLKKIL